MQTVAIYTPQSDVMGSLLNYLRSHKYKNISVNYNYKEIRAERKRSLFKTDKFQFKIVDVNQTVTNIEIKVNPQKDSQTSDDLKKESTLAEKIYSYF